MEEYEDFYDYDIEVEEEEEEEEAAMVMEEEEETVMIEDEAPPRKEGDGLSSADSGALVVADASGTLDCERERERRDR